MESDGIFTTVNARLTKDFTFEAAQTLPNAPQGHKCRRVHGHSFKVEVSVEGRVDPKTGWVYDHADISAAMKPILHMLDHTNLNDIEGLENPTIEKMAEWFWQKLESQCPASARSWCTKRPPRGAFIAATSLARTSQNNSGSSLGSRIEFSRRPLLQIDRVALHLVVEGGALDTEKFGRFFLVAPAFCERLENGIALHVIQRLYAAAW